MRLFKWIFRLGNCGYVYKDKRKTSKTQSPSLTYAVPSCTTPRQPTIYLNKVE